MCGGKQNTTGPVRKDRKGEAGILIGRRLKQRLPISFLVLAPRLCRGVQKSLSVQQKKQKRQINNIRETDLYKNSFRKGLYQKTGKTNDSAPIEIERLSISRFPVGVSPLRVSDHTNALRRGQYHRALPACAEPPTLLVGYYCLSNHPGSAGGSEKALAIRMKEKLLLVR